MTPVARHLVDLIETQGPISVATFMSIVLGHPQHGYYTAQKPFGSSGDFVTAPEVSQVFGELLGLWCVQAWMDCGKPAPFNFVELGPGRGTLIVDAMRAATQVAPEFVKAAQVYLVEASASLRAEQKKCLDAAAISAKWLSRFGDLPKRPAILIANEFFDALPIHQYTFGGDGWRERFVTVDKTNGKPRFVFTLSPTISKSPLPAGLKALEGDLLEVSPASIALGAEIGAVIIKNGGAALIVDYGYAATAVGDTLQAVRDHAFHDVLSDVGTADLTAHVNFQHIAEAAGGEGARVWKPIAQGDFLTQLGIKQRCAKLVAGKPSDIATSLQQDVVRLISPTQMGTLFKVLAIADTKDWHPAGFESTDLYDFDKQNGRS